MQFAIFLTDDPGKRTLHLVPDSGHNAFLQQPSVVFSPIENSLTAAELATTH